MFNDDKSVFFLVSRWTLLVGIAVFFWSPSTEATSKPSSYVLRGVSGTPSHVRVAISKLSRPVWHTIKSGKARKLREVLAERCGKQPHQTQKYLEAETIHLNHVKNLDAVVKPGEAVAFPNCLKIIVKVRVKPKKHDTLKALLQREYGVFGPKTKKAFFDLNKYQFAYKSDVDVSNRLKSGHEVYVPYKSPKTVFVPKSGAMLSPIELIGSQAPKNIFDQYMMAAVPAPMPKDQKQYETEFIPSVDLLEAGAGYKCGGKAGEVARIVDVAKLTARFAAEAIKQEKLFNHGPTSTTVGIIDSGIVGFGKGIFEERFFRVNLLEKKGSLGIDDDNPKNGHIDDIFGSNFSYMDGGIEPIAKDSDEKSHGTKMASLILGGPKIAVAWTSQFNPPMIRLRIVDFSDRVSSRGTVLSHLLGQAIDYLHADFKDHQASIINMSLKTSKDLKSLKGTMTTRNDLLFIVAAGNGPDSPNRKLEVGKIYPAIYGGKGIGLARHVVTVGAHNLDGNLANFSSFSPDFVDLLAPGCAVETREIDGTIALNNGTSPATAIVSFAAALVRSLGETTPTEIKNRLVLGTDVDQALEDKTRASGRLNILKAISLYHDVIETKSGAGTELAFGTLSDPTTLIGFCDFNNRPPDPPLDVRKIIPNLKDGMLHYWVKSDGRLSRLKCKQRDSNKSIGKIWIDGKEVDGPPLNQVKEVILSSYR